MGMTLANKITVLRILSLPFFVWAMLDRHVDLARAIFLISAVTDALDGALARLRGERTPLGSFLDPLADKLLLTTTFTVLTALGRIPTWAFIAVISRDILIILGFTVVFILTGHRTISPRPPGKVATALQMTFAVAILFNLPEPFPTVLLYAMITATLISAVDYIWVGNQRLGAIH